MRCSPQPVIVWLVWHWAPSPPGPVPPQKSASRVVRVRQGRRSAEHWKKNILTGKNRAWGYRKDFEQRQASTKSNCHCCYCHDEIQIMQSRMDKNSPQQNQNLEQLTIRPCADWCRLSCDWIQKTRAPGFPSEVVKVRIRRWPIHPSWSSKNENENKIKTLTQLLRSGIAPIAMGAWCCHKSLAQSSNAIEHRCSTNQEDEFVVRQRSTIAAFSLHYSNPHRSSIV